MNIETYKKLRSDLTQIESASRLEWITENYKADGAGGIDDSFEFLFRCEGDEKELYHLRRYLHLNYPISILVYEDLHSHAPYGKISVRFKLVSRNRVENITEPESLNIHSQYSLNPQYDNIDELQIPVWDGKGDYGIRYFATNDIPYDYPRILKQWWDNVRIVTKDEIDAMAYDYANDPKNIGKPIDEQSILDAFKPVDNDPLAKYIYEEENKIERKSVCVTGKFARGTRDEIHKMIRKVGGYVDTKPNFSTSVLIVGERPGKTKLESAKRHGVEIMTQEEFYKILDKK